jgi:hypothetical protein
MRSVNKLPIDCAALNYNCQEDERSSLPMLRNVVMEGHRLEPVAPFSGRVSNKDIIYKKGKDIQIICSLQKRNIFQRSRQISTLSMGRPK